MSTAEKPGFRLWHLGYFKFGDPPIEFKLHDKAVNKKKWLSAFVKKRNCCDIFLIKYIFAAYLPSISSWSLLKIYPMTSTFNQIGYEVLWCLRCCSSALSIVSNRWNSYDFITFIRSWTCRHHLKEGDSSRGKQDCITFY